MDYTYQYTRDLRPQGDWDICYDDEVKPEVPLGSEILAALGLGSRIQCDGPVCLIIFEVELTPAQKVVLDQVVADHKAAARTP